MTRQEREALVAYRMENAEETLREVKSHCANEFWNTAINRMYYACYYAASALLISREIPTRTHEGVRRELGRCFVVPGILDAEFGRFYSQLFGKRSKGDYEDFLEFANVLGDFCCFTVFGERIGEKIQHRTFGESRC